MLKKLEEKIEKMKKYPTAECFSDGFVVRSKKPKFCDCSCGRHLAKSIIRFV